MRAALALAFDDRRAVAVGIVAAVGAGVLFATGGQMLAQAGGGVVLLVTPAKAAIFAALALLVGMAGVVQTCAFRLRLARSSGASAVTGVVFAVVGASCCMPLLWPAALSVLGVSGVTLLTFNADLHRWFWIPMALAATALLAGLAQGLRAIAAACRVVPAGHDGIM